jgi:hypothetical protein
VNGDFDLKLSASDEKKITGVVQKKFAKYVAKWRTKKVKDLETFLKKNIDDFKKDVRQQRKVRKRMNSIKELKNG